MPSLQHHEGLAPASPVCLKAFILLLVRTLVLQKAGDEEGIEVVVAIRYQVSLPKKIGGAVVYSLFQARYLNAGKLLGEVTCLSRSYRCQNSGWY